MKKENIISIYNNIPKTLAEFPVTFSRFRSCNAYIADKTLTVFDDESKTWNTVTLIKSYETIVAFYNHNTHCFCEIGKFSRTTSKQLTQIYNTFYGGERINAMHITW